MAFAKLFLASLAFSLALVPGQTQTCVCNAVYFTLCQRYDQADVVLHAKVLSRSSVDFNYANYTLNTITLFKGEEGVTYTAGEASFITPAYSFDCGVRLEIGNEYLVGLHALGEHGGYTVPPCHGLYELWSTSVEEELIECGVLIDQCAGACEEFEECKVYENNGKFYCSEICAGGACGYGENCSTQPRKWCQNTGFAGCPTKRRCS